MKKKILTGLALAILFIPHTVHASAFCDISEKVRLKNLASNINKSYDYVELDDKAIFKITLSNVYKELFLKRIGEKREAIQEFYPNRGQDMSEIILENYESGKSYTFEVYTNHFGCEGDVIETIYVTLPTYNPFYKLSVCQGLDNYEMCTKWYNHGLSKEKFIEVVQEYRNQKEEESGREEEHNSYLLEFYLKYYYILLPTIILGLGYIIYKENKKGQFF